VRSSAAMTHARACQAADFKNCCMLSNEFDGSDRHHFFQGVEASCTSLERSVNGERLRAAGAGDCLAPAALHRSFRVAPELHG
jgi:hypothetical protein